MNKKYTTEEFIIKAKAKHGEKYSYSCSTYINSNTKISILCPFHGEFRQLPTDHIRGRGCSRCGGSHRLTIDEFITRSNIVHQGKYDYSLSKYKNSNTDIIVICNEHGEFLQKPHDHIDGHGCPYCAKKKLPPVISTKITKSWLSTELQTKTIAEIATSLGIGGTTLGNYVRQFELTPNVHKSAGERSILEYVISIYHGEIWTNNSKILKNNMELDIVLPEINIAIEYNGLYWHSTKYRTASYHIDKLKECGQLGLKLLHIFEDEWIYDIDYIKSVLDFHILGTGCPVDTTGDIILVNTAHFRASDFVGYRLIESYSPRGFGILRDRRVSMSESDIFIFDCGELLLEKC